MAIRDMGNARGQASLRASTASFATGLAAGATIAQLNAPFGAGTSYQAIGSPPAQLALSGQLVVQGAAAATAGQSYAIKIRASSADGAREVAETLRFAATAAGVASPYMAAATRIGTHDIVAFAATAATKHRFYQQYLGNAPWDGAAPIGILLNATNAQGRLFANTNVVNVEKAGYIVGGTLVGNTVTGGTFHPVTFGGAAAGVVPVGGDLGSWLAHDPGGFTVPANTPVWFQIAYSVTGDTDKLPGTTGAYGMGGNGGPNLGERYTQGATSQAANVGSPFTAGGALPVQLFGLVGFFTRGCPDPSKVYLSLHDSIGQGSSNPQFAFDARGNIGFLHQMLDSPGGGGRRSFWSVGIFSQSLLSSTPAVQTNSVVRWVKAVADMLGNVPFTGISSALGHNDAGAGYASAKSLFDGFADWCRTNLNHSRWVQFEGGIKTAAALDSKFTTEADQTASAGFGAGATQDQLKAYWATGAGGRVDYLIPHYAPVLDATGYRWKTGGLFASTLSVAVAANATSVVQLADAPPVGAVLVFEPGDAANVDPVTSVVYFVQSVTGSGPYAVQLRGVQNYSQNILKAHAAGSVVREALTPDGEHPGKRAHDLMRDGVIATYKAAAYP